MNQIKRTNHRQTRHAVIFGSGGLALELLGYMDSDGGYQVEAIVSTEPMSDPMYQYPVLPAFPPDLYGCECYLAVAMPNVKRAIVKANPNANWATYVHHSCFISPHAKIGKGCVFAPQSLVCGDAVIGDFVFFNTNATIGHDSRVGDYSTLFPNSEVCGDCYIGEGCILGINSSVLPKVKMTNGANASAHACVRKDVVLPVTVYGDPAKPRELTTPQALPLGFPRCDLCRGTGIESFGVATFPCRRCFPDLARAA